VGHLSLAGANTCSARVADGGNQEMLVRGSMWNVGVAASHCRIAMNRLRIHHINHKNSQNQ
jgi:hypothetical protein